MDALQDVGRDALVPGLRMLLPADAIVVVDGQSGSELLGPDVAIDPGQKTRCVVSVHLPSDDRRNAQALKDLHEHGRGGAGALGDTVVCTDAHPRCLVGGARREPGWATVSGSCYASERTNGQTSSHLRTLA